MLELVMWFEKRFADVEYCSIDWYLTCMNEIQKRMVVLERLIEKAGEMFDETQDYGYIDKRSIYETRLKALNEMFGAYAEEIENINSLY